MDFSNDAKREIEKNLDEVVRYINVDGKERADIVKELRSTYYEAAETEARARGAAIVTAEDARAARESVSSPRETADCFMKSYAAGLKRAGFLSRLVAFALDNILLFGLSCIVMSPIMLYMVLLDMPTDEAANETWFFTLSPLMMALFIVVVIIVTISFFAVMLGYYVLLEGRFGRTPGKYAMGLKVLRTDGTKIGYKEALLRNISKYFDFLIVIDALIMLIFFYKEKQRGFDRIANTMVVHMRR
jgi:uncharacterized RDD family membrane protein YckC